ncbi:MAG: hypothetical protein F9K51_06035, partial [Candidatus Dadabacteria bacterium]
MNVKGRVVAGDAPVSGASVSLFVAGSVVSESLAFGKTDSEGNFSINFNKPAENGIVYAIARGGKPRGSPG